jgi:hypothetical protein
MLFLILTYHDTLYLATELGALVLVLLAYWLLPLPQHHPDR